MFLVSEVPLYLPFRLPTHHQSSEREKIDLFKRLDFFHESLDSSELQYKSRTRKKRLDPALTVGA